MLKARSIFFACIILFVCSQAAMAERITCASANGIKTEAEFKPVAKQGVNTLDVTFIGKRPTNKEADRVLRDCLAVAIKRDSSKDILASPWFRKRAKDNPADDILMHLYGGLRYLSYEISTKDIGVRELKLKKK